MPEIDEQEPDSGYLRLEQQIRWYDRKSMAAQRYFRRAKIAEITCAALVPFMVKIQTTVAAVLGVVVVVLEGMQQVSQWSQNWITYRSTCEALRHEKYSYMARSGVYEGKSDEEARRILAQRVESLVSTEHAKWISRQEYDISKTGKNN
jgi:hypothetical protein